MTAPRRMTEDEFLAETERLIQDTGTATIHKPDKPKRGGKDVRVQQGTKAR